MRKMLSIIGYIMLSIVLGGCGTNKTLVEYPSNYKELSKYIGESTDVVLSELNLTEDEMILSGLYQLPNEAEFYGQKYQTYLGAGEEITSIQYRLSIENNMEEAVHVVEKLRDNLLSDYGEGDEGIINGLGDQTDLNKALSREKSYASYWDLSDECPKNIKAYMNELAKESSNSGVFYKLYVSVFSDGKSTVSIEIYYRIIKSVLQ